MDKQISLEEQRQIQFDILKTVDRFCNENSINYSLAFGTLIGAVRHNGFIPWDDDVDIMMTRDNYEKFRLLYHSDRYPLIDLKTDNSYPLSMGKVHDNCTYYYRDGIRRNFGLFIDVFPLDNVPDDITTRQKWLKKIQRLNAFNITKNSSLSSIISNKDLSVINKMKGVVIKLIISSSYIHNRMEKLYIKYNTNFTKDVGVPAVMSMKEAFNSKVFPRDLFQEYTVLKFENVFFPVIKGYDQFLSIFYGNYLELPPIDQRKGKHDIVGYYK